MSDQTNKELLELFAAVGKLKQYLETDPKGTALADDALNKIFRYYKSDQIARAGRYVIDNILSQHPHLHHSEAPVAGWGFEVLVSCDNCGQEEKHRIVKHAVDIATAAMLGKHQTCKKSSAKTASPR